MNKSSYETSQPFWIWPVKVVYLYYLCDGWVVKYTVLTHSWSIRQPPTPNYKPHCSLHSLILLFHHLYPLLPLIPFLSLTSHLLCRQTYSHSEMWVGFPRMQLTWGHSLTMDTLPIWLCQIPSLRLCISHSVFFCLFTLSNFVLFLFVLPFFYYINFF